MRHIVTQNSTYVIKRAHDQDVISLPGERHVGKLYGILGCYDPKKHSFKVTPKEVFFDGVPREYEELPPLLENPLSPGKCVVARLLTSEGRFSEGPSIVEFLQTSEIQDILD